MPFVRTTRFVVVGLIACVTPGRATQPAPYGWTGIPRFGVLLTLAEQPRLGEQFRIRVAAGPGQHLRDAVGEVHIRIPRGVEVVEGDTVRQVHPGRNWMGPVDSQWDLYLRPSRIGRYEIRGWLRVPRESRDSWDESECILELDVRADTVIVVRFGHPVRHERVVSGARFRYGGKHMVLIDGPESEGSVQQIATEPRAVHMPKANCKGCGLTRAATVRSVVTVGADGSVKWIEPRAAREETDIDPRIIAAAEEAVKRWRFQPAMSENGRAVAQWAEVLITVEP